MMATLIALNLDIQLHGGSNLLLNIEGRIPRNTVHLLYCGLQIDNNRGNHYDALLEEKVQIKLRHGTGHKSQKLKTRKIHVNSKLS